MKYNGFSYLIGEGFRNVLKNKKSTVISIMTMVCTMFLFGIFYAIGINVNSILKQVQLQQGMRVFIIDETTEEQKQQFESEIKALDGVNTVTYMNKQEALDEFKVMLRDKQKYLNPFEGENNIFPASFIVTLTNLEKSKEVQEEIARIGARLATEGRNDEVDLEIEETTEHDTIIDEIRDSDRIITTLLKIVKGVRLAIGVIFLVLLIISITIISNTIKLTVHARRKEISIMKYVGATNGFIRWPFIIEGIVIGIIAAILTLLVVGVLYDFVIQKIGQSEVLQQIDITLLNFVEIAEPITIVYASLGIGIGIIGSVMSMKKYLEV